LSYCAVVSNLIILFIYALVAVLNCLWFCLL